jgi:polyether ionophore transport system permease protein
MSPVTGTGPLTTLALRRDRLMLAAWVYVLTAWVVGTAYALRKLYPTAAAQHDFAATVVHNSLFVALYDPLFGTSLGALTAWRIGSPTALLAGLMSVFIVVRHTRGDEETGRLELVGAASVGRQAALTAALVVASGASLVFAALTMAGLILLGLPAVGALVLGLAAASAGWVFAAIAAIAAQLAQSARTARGIAIAAVAAAYLLRDIGSAVGGAAVLMWLSPVGWAVQVRPFGGDRLWVLGLPLGATAIAAAAAYALSARRDLGAGLFPARPGPARAAGWLRAPAALAWRLQRAGLAGWAAGVAAIGAIIGILAPAVGSLVGSSGGLENAFTKLGGSSTLTDAFLASMTALYGLIAAAYAVTATLRLRTEETAQRAEPVLAAPVGRIRWAAGHVVIAAGGAAVLLAVAGLASGLADAARSGDAGQVPRLLGAAMAQLPAAWLLAGVAIALFGYLPRLAAAAWAVLMACLLFGQLGPLLRLPQWVMDVSPFTHVPKLPGAAFSFTPLAWLTAAAAMVTAAGLAGLRRRDVG